MTENEICWAVISGDVAGVRSLLAEGVDPDDYQHRCFDSLTPLAVAAEYGNPDVVEALLAAGADPNATIIGDDGPGDSPVHRAIAYDREAVFHTLMRHGGDLAVEGSCGHAICIAVLWEGREDWIARLVSLGGDINRPNREGFTPLMLAAANDALEALRTLIAFGAQLEIRDKLGLTAYLHAACAGDHSAGKLLRDAGADVTATTYDGQDAASLAQENGFSWPRTDQ